MVLRVEVHPMLGLAACLLEPSLLVQTTPPLLLQPLGSMTAAEMELARCMGGGGEDKGGGADTRAPDPSSEHQAPLLSVSFPFPHPPTSSHLLSHTCRRSATVPLLSLLPLNPHIGGACANPFTPPPPHL